MTAGQANSDRHSTAVGYLRRSTSQQEQSIPDQRAAIERYAAQHNLQLIHFYTDDAITGTRTKGRKAFQAMMAAAQRGDCEFGVVIVYDIKRFGRVDNDEAGHYRYVLRTHGVEVRYVSEHFTGHSTDDLLRAVKQWQAREESKDLSKVTIRGLLSKVTSNQAKGRWMGGVPPFGYDLRYEKPSGAFMFYVRHMRDRTKELFDERWTLLRTLRPDESPALTRQDHCRLVLSGQDRVETVGEIYQLYLEERRGFTAIADRLNRLGVPTIRGTSWSNKCGTRWTCSVIRQILTNPAYVGDLAWNRRTHGKINQIRNGEAVERTDALIRKWRFNEELDWIVVRDTHPPIVSRSVWERTNWMIREQAQLFVKETRDTGSPKLKLLRRMTFTWTGSSARFLLSQLAICAHCGSRYEGCVVQNARRKPQGKREHKYLC
ncbi:MAG: recombinase family protein [Gammaproteobacteria bacterium]|nr:recombinase family protein [Gammaproteobacteria bacterium]